MRNNKFLGFFSAALTFSVFAAACSSDSVNSSDSKSKTYESSLSNVVSESGSTEKKADSLQCSSNIENVFSDRDLSGEYDAPDCEITLSGDSAAVSGNGAVESDGNISITEKGVYLVSGKLNDGSIIIDTDEKVQLVLNNAEISCSDSAVIYAKNSQKLFITVPENTESTLSDGTEYKLSSESENEPDACIFSADSLTVNGKGTLNINGSYNEGITSKDDIVAAGCTINVNSAGNGIKGKDSIALYDARLNIISGKDGLKTTNYKDEELGFIYSVDSSADIVSEEDGIQAETEFISENSNFSITSGGGFENAEQKTDNEFMKPNGGGDFRREENLYPNDQITASDSDSISTKGIKTASLMLIKGGSFNINAADDALHSSSSLSISGGTLNLASGDDGIHADSQLDISGGDITITDSYEGIESAQINICGGNIKVNSSDDGLNANNGSAKATAAISITGGNICVNSGGDGLDSNGDICINDGTVLVNGPTNDGNGALDSNGEINVNGGILVAVGSSGMAEAPGTNSAQCSASFNLPDTQEGGTLVTVCDEDDKEILSFMAEKQFSSVIVSAPDIIEGKTYTVYCGGTTAANEIFGGLYESGGYNGDSDYSSDVTAANSDSMGGFHMGMQSPDGENDTPHDFQPQGGDSDRFHKPPTGENGMPEMPDDRVAPPDAPDRNAQ